MNENIFDYIESNFGRTLSPIEYEEVSSWEDNELTRYAIKQAVLNGKYGIKYISAILYSYKMNNIKSVQQAQLQDEQFRKSKQMKQKTILKENVPSWYNQKQDDDLMSEEELREFEKMLGGNKNEM